MFDTLRRRSRIERLDGSVSGEVLLVLANTAVGDTMMGVREVVTVNGRRRGVAFLILLSMGFWISFLAFGIAKALHE